ncbi:MAG TPA: acyl carrier protein [Candidatus Izemoplasmatales bacterium]|nr:acyl carrier protein [Candidatus Izemoplasmatales bacterium]
MTLLETLKSLISSDLGVDESNIKMESRLVEDLGADSLDAVELIMSIEDAFEIEIDDQVTNELKSVKDIVDYIENNQ